ncbi:2Fe-2S iron-sulfur cluster-binding protein [Aliibacillus thermotolerans]|uniref:2Fe-2S iron-sulfur cluster-binding protein n=1 Tax=Aliibacillus thermotolerans TaxID=1834418 RepID=A0ABW0U1K6_9BACI|nr:2Fe-2S iron-sulfur cluster-binding protein [Aliibacillus thermotolerans]MDA3129507.1 2Fe-2S iron-sulfur cluster binding domain-containing protein [Aliibacillus thermotolerans]
MPKVKLHIDGELIEKEVDKNANLVVLAGIKQFPKLKYGCGMGRCTRCTCRVLKGAENLDEPNWKEKKMLGDKLEEGYRLTCQLSIQDDIEITQENISIRPPRRKKSVTEMK